MISTLIYGLTIGGILYLISIGLSLTFGSMRIVNFAHGMVYTTGAYILIAVLPFLKKNSSQASSSPLWWSFPSAS